MTWRIDAALVKSFRDGNFGITVVEENQKGLDNPENPSVEITVLQGEIDPSSLADKDINTGIMNFTLRYPQYKGESDGKKKASEIFDYYRHGRSFIFEGQSVEVTGKARLSNRNESGFYQIIGQIRYRAFIER